MENARPAESVFVVSGSHLRGPYQLQCVSLEGETSTLPSHIDPMDPQYTFDPRVQKHKDEVIMRSSLKPDQQTLSVQPVEPIVKLHASIQRRDPRLARKEAMAIKEETLNPSQQQQQLGAVSLKYGVTRGSSQQNLIGAVQQSSSIQVEGDMQHDNMPVRGIQLGGMPMGDKQQGNMPMGVLQQGNMPLESMQHCNMPVGGVRQGTMTMGAMQQGNMPMGAMQRGNMPMGGMQQGSIPFGGMQQVNLPVGRIMQGNMPVDGILQGSLQMQQIMSMGGMRQTNMQMGNTQQGNMHIGGMQHNIMGGMQQGNRPVVSMQHGNLLMGGMQNHVNMSVSVRNQTGMSLRPMLQEGMQAGGVQQCSQMMSSVQHGCLMDESNDQGRMSAVVGGLHLRGAVPGSHVPINGMQHSGMSGSGIHQSGMSVNGMQQHMNIPMRRGMQQGGGLLHQPSSSFLHQRGFVHPFLIQSQASVINCFPQSVNTQPPFSTCNRAGMLQHDMVRLESMPTNHDRLSDKGEGDDIVVRPADVCTSNPAAANSISVCVGDMFAPVQSNPVVVQPQLSVTLKATSVIASPSVSPSLQPSCSSLQTVTCDNLPHKQIDIVCEEEQYQVTQLTHGADVVIDNNGGCNQGSSHNAETLDDVSLTSNVERTLNYGEDHRFRIKKAQTKDFEENSSEVVCNSGMLMKASDVQSKESNTSAHKTVVRNRDKLEFRSPLADMGDGGSSLLVSGYNQPPNKKYQQLAEENNLRRSVCSKATNKDSGKQKRQSTSHQMPPSATQNELLPPAILNLQPTPDATLNSELAHSIQSVKDMFKSIDPTASPFC